uniref:phage integrase SAM-like domain-containing protein n=1 Tax=Alistipes sp. TaxID=1872444 RepID=UPI00405642A1
MASVKIAIDTRRALKNGTYPIIVKVSVLNTCVLLRLGMYASEKEWNSVLARYRETSEYFIEKNKVLSRYLFQCENKVREMELTGEIRKLGYSEIKTMLKKCLEGDSISTSVQDHFRVVISGKGVGTAKIYTLTLKKINAFNKNLPIDFSDITHQWLVNFEVYLKNQGHGINGINLHMRNLRAVINDAIKNKILTKYDYPFLLYRMKSEPTKHRDLSVDDIRVIRDYDDPQYRKYLDIWMLIFYLGGINIGDLLLLKKSALNNGHITYRRQKTRGEYIVIPVVEEAQKIIDKYHGENHLLNILDIYSSNYKTFLRRMDKALKSFGPYTIRKHGKKERRPIFPFLSTYWARHSFATIACEECDIPEDIVGRILGHKQKSVTGIYISRKQRKIDDAMLKVCHFINLDKEADSNLHDRNNKALLAQIAHLVDLLQD